jgi:hypothetical protein
MEKLFYITIISVLFFSNLHNANAIENPLTSENNKFGIHIINESDLEDASRLVNSSGGDWGYVTLVIREDERDISRYQKIFDRARRLHLIPIVRIATKQDGENWTKPAVDDVGNWVTFFDSLNWVVRNRYIIVGNEPNHASEWGGQINPVEYAEYYENLSIKLKTSSPDYFLMISGLDASAPDNKIHMGEEKFLKKVLSANSNIFEYVDGWVSHSYPNPGFSASPQNSGQKSVKTYEWELSLLKRLGVNKILPVFITETGWAHKTDNDKSFLDPEQLSDYYKKLFEIYQNDNRVVAFTPFILNYNNPPFDIFSWKKNDGNFYPFYEETQKILKITGRPNQITEAKIIFEMIPEFIKKGDNIFAAGIAKNTGQTIWMRDLSIRGTEKDSNVKLEIDSSIFTDIEPGKIGIILYRKL